MTPIEFFLNNQPAAPIIQIYSVIKLCMMRSMLTLFGRGHQKPGMKPTSAEYTVENS
jgi:hypothetical protein